MEVGEFNSRTKKVHSVDISDYRPVSVLPVVSKVLERLIHQQLYDYLQQHSILHPAQSGFRPWHTTQDLIVSMVDAWKKALDRNKIVGVALMDLSKAFDRVNHSILLKKLSSYGVRGKEWRWFQDYLTGRRQRVCLGEEKSGWIGITKGVRQGSIPGPLHRGQSRGLSTGVNPGASPQGSILGPLHRGQSWGLSTGVNPGASPQGSILGPLHRGQSRGLSTGVNPGASPQGSIPGPLPFTIYVNDLPKAVSQSEVKQYVDDTTMFPAASSTCELESVLEADLQSVSKWVEDNKLQLNKTQLLLLGRRGRAREAGSVRVSLDGKQLPRSRVRG